MERKWNGNGMEQKMTNQVEENFDGMEWKWNGSGMEVEWKNSSDKVNVTCIGNGNGNGKK